MFYFVLLLCFVVIIDSRPTLDWGTYRPGYYLGLRARHPRSPLFGFLWYDAGILQGIQQSRHACQDSDKLSTYGWIRHNGHDFGQQILFDPVTNLHLTTSFIKFPFEENEEAWISIVEAQNIPNGPNIASGVVGTVWYVVSGENDLISEDPYLSIRNETIFAKGTRFAEGNIVQIDGTMKMDDTNNESNSNYEYTFIQILDEQNRYGPTIRPTKKGNVKSTTMDKRTYVTGLHMNNDNKWKTKDIFNQMMEQQVQKLYRKSRKAIEKRFPDPQKQNEIYSKFSPNLKHGLHIKNESLPANVFLAQNFLVAPFRIYYIYLPSRDVTVTSFDDLPELINSKEKIDTMIADNMKAFDRQFDSVYNVEVKPKEEKDNDELKYNPENGRRYIAMGEMQLARYALSNLLGGIGYWYGNQIYQMHPKQSAQYTDDGSLFSAVPSRSFFPRGFLWDEGFHQLLVGIWDCDLSIDIIQSWLGKMDDNGWIAREQILGDEARSRVPTKFQIQKPHIANPPTMFLAIHALVERYYHSTDEQLEAILCKKIGNNEDIAQVDVDSDGVQNDKIEQELCKQMIAETRMKVKLFLESNFDKLVVHFNWYISTQTSPNGDGDSFRWAGRERKHNLPSGLDDYPRFVNVTKLEGHVDMHCWMIKLHSIMSDLASYMNDNEKANEWKQRTGQLQLSLNNFHWNTNTNAYQDYAILEGEKFFVEHIGYVSSFPLFLQVLPPNSLQLIHLLNQISDEEGMWSAYGLRSLAKSDALYGTDEDYWRGSIWINMNYLAVKALHDYSENCKDECTQEVQDLLKQTYNGLRDNLIANMYKGYARHGFVYENYNGDSGLGQRSKPFTGWSALILNIITEIYP